MSRNRDTNAKESLLKSLEAQGMRDQVRSWAQQVMGLAQTACWDDVQGFEDLKDDWNGSLELGFESHGPPESVFAGLLTKTEAPHIITMLEVGNAFSAYLVGNDHRIWNDFDELYQGFLDHVRFRLLIERDSSPIELCEMWDLSGDDDQTSAWLLAVGAAIGKAQLLGSKPELPLSPEPEMGLELKLWARNGLELRVIGLRTFSRLLGHSPTVKHNGHGTLLVQLHGAASGGAIDVIASDLIPAVRAVVRSISLLRPCGEPRLIVSHLPELRFCEFLEYRAFIVGCAEVVFSPATKKDTMSRRFGNAVRLLAQADIQTSPAIELAMSVAAIEALLGKKGAEIASTLSNYVAVLLEPELSQRAAASAFVKRLYDDRSRTLHGDTLDQTDSIATKARLLAAACLFGLWFRHDLKHRLGEKPDTPDDLLKELRERNWDARQPSGVPEVPAARELWCHAAKDK